MGHNNTTQHRELRIHTRPYANNHSEHAPALDRRIGSLGLSLPHCERRGVGGDRSGRNRAAEATSTRRGTKISDLCDSERSEDQASTERSQHRNCSKRGEARGKRDVESEFVALETDLGTCRYIWCEHPIQCIWDHMNMKNTRLHPVPCRRRATKGCPYGCPDTSEMHEVWDSKSGTP